MVINPTYLTARGFLLEAKPVGKVTRGNPTYIQQGFWPRPNFWAKTTVVILPIYNRFSGQNQTCGQRHLWSSYLYTTGFLAQTKLVGKDTRGHPTNIRQVFWPRPNLWASTPVVILPIYDRFSGTDQTCGQRHLWSSYLCTTGFWPRPNLWAKTPAVILPIYDGFSGPDQTCG